MIQAINALLKAICGDDPVIERTIVYRDDFTPGEWLSCKTTQPMDGDTVIVATRDTYPNEWGKGMKAFNGWLMIGSSSTLPVGEPVWWRYE